MLYLQRLFYLTIFVICSACQTGPFSSAVFLENRVPFTQYIREEYNIPADKLKKMQYYVSGTVTLSREISTQEREQARGQVFSQAGKLIEEIVIEGGTPGVAIKTGPNSIAVSFEEGSYLWFGSLPNSRQEWKGKYVLFAQNWQEGVGTVDFMGKVYTAKKGSGQAYLLIDRDWQEDVIQRRELRGRRVE